MAKKFFCLMMHNPTVDQAEAARQLGTESVVAMARKPEPKKPGDAEPTPGVEYLGITGLLNVPEDPELAREWFVAQAAKIVSAVDLHEGDIVHCMGQYQLTDAVNAHARRLGATLLESVTKRDSVDVTQPDGSIKKEAVFKFQGYRPVYEF